MRFDQGIFASYIDKRDAVVHTAAAEPGMHILELGTGNLALCFVALGCEVWGVDSSSTMLAIAREKVPQVMLFHTDLTGA